MTANVYSDDIARGRAAGMNAHLAKPIDPQLLYAALDAWLPKSAADAAADAANLPPSVKSVPREIQAAFSTETPQWAVLSNLKGIDVQAGLSNVAGNHELYLWLLDRFAKNYRNSGVELRDALKRMAHDSSAYEEAIRLAHTAKGVAANLGARALATVAGELESALKKEEAREEILARYELLLREVLEAIDSLPKRDGARVGRKAVPAADRERIAAVLDVLPVMMQEDWYGAEQELLALAPIVEDTVISAHFREVAMSLEEFDSEGVEEKGKLLLAVFDQGEAG
jgi:HPt (histidine-containing phosphotransfer) domain-containing protein